MATTSDVWPDPAVRYQGEQRDPRALMNAVSAAYARIRCICAEASAFASRSLATEMATKSSPISAPATPALATKKS